MTAYLRALDALLAQPWRTAMETIALGEAAARIVARDIHATADLPGFDNAAMDGFAIAARGGVVPHGASFAVQASQAAGDAGHLATNDTAWEIMTGAQLPSGLDSVIPVEKVDVLASDGSGRPSRIRLRDDVHHGDNVRVAGSDITPGQCLLGAGHAIDPAATMLLAATGIANVHVWRQPRVAIICTGKELSADAGGPLADGRIHNSNGPFLAAALPRMGALIAHQATVDDEGTLFRKAMATAQANGADLVLTTGAVSAGRHDFIPSALESMGATTIFRQVAMRPGKPMMAACCTDGTVVVSLPGNPMAVAAGLRFFVAPLLRKWLGQPAARPLRARLDVPLQTIQSMRLFIQANARHNSDGELRVQPTPGQKAYRIRPYVDANAWLVLDEAALGRVGDVVDVHSLDADGRWRWAP